MKASSEKTAAPTSTPAPRTTSQPFFAKAGAGSFFEPAARSAAPAVQLKMQVNQPGDKFEQEADRMADQVVRQPLPLVKNDPWRPNSPAARALSEARLPKAARPTSPVQRAELPDEKRFVGPPAIQRQSTAGPPVVGAGVQAAIRQRTTGGQPLAADVRGYMEPRFGADFSQVRVHHDAAAAGLNAQLSARAFTHQNHVFFSPGQYQPGTSEGRHLLAHELTHTIQQGNAVQRSPQVTATATAPPIQRLGLRDLPGVGGVLDYFAEAAYLIPGFRLLTLVIGFNPITQQTTDRSAANLLRALIELMPGGYLVSQALDNHGVFTKAGAWVEQQLATFRGIGSAIGAGLRTLLENSLLSLPSPSALWAQARQLLAGPVGQLISFAGSVVGDLLHLVKTAILKPLAALAEGTAGYDLLKTLLGEDPVTGEPVPRTADTLLGGFMKLIGQEEIWQNLKKGNAVPRAWAWFQGALAGLLGFARSIPQRVAATLASLTFQEVLTVAGAFARVVGNLAGIAGEFMSWGLQQVISLLEILFSVVAPGAIPYIKKAQGAFQTILRNPIGFVNNLVQAGKLGFIRFAGNIAGHLMKGLLAWLTAPMARAGIYVLKSFSLPEILKMVASALGLTWPNIRKKLLKIIPEPVLMALEKTAGILVTFVQQGPAAALEQIKTELTELKDQLISQVIEMVTSQVVQAAVTKLVSLFNPAGAVIQAIIAIYNTISVFINQLSQIGAVVAAFIDSIAAIAAGQLEGAAKKVEQTMAGLLPIVIAFFAKFAGAGSIPDKLLGLVMKGQKFVEKGIDKVVAWLGGLLKKLGLSKAAKQKQASLEQPVTMRSTSHKLVISLGSEPKIEMRSNAGELISKIVYTRSELSKRTPKPSAQIAALDKLSTTVQSFNRWLKSFAVSAKEVPTSAPQIAGLVAELTQYGTTYDASDIDPMSDSAETLRKHPGYQWLASNGLAEAFEARIILHLSDFPIAKIRTILTQITRFSAHGGFTNKVRETVTRNKFWAPNSGFFYEIEILQNVNSLRLVDIEISASKIDVLTGDGKLIDAKYSVDLDTFSIGTPTPALSARMLRQISDMSSAVGTTIAGIRVTGWQIHHRDALAPSIVMLLRSRGILNNFTQS